jgi:hypothetical protein
MRQRYHLDASLTHALTQIWLIGGAAPRNNARLNPIRAQSWR